MRVQPVLLFALLVCLPALLSAQDTRADKDAPKQATAVRIQSDAIRLDGRLDDAAWRDVPAITDFTQREPLEGAPATERMEVRFVYDNDAVYVGARMYSQNAATIQAPLGRHDNLGAQAEHFFVSFDTYYNRRTAYTFGVSASGALTPAQASPFMGTWVIEMTEPAAFRGTHTVRVWEKDGAVAASLQSGKFPATEATGIHRDGDEPNHQTRNRQEADVTYPLPLAPSSYLRSGSVNT